MDFLKTMSIAASGLRAQAGRIPPEHDKAIAEVIGYVMKLRRSAYATAS